jgi:K+-transporting ATPase ATPase B chain
MIRNPVMFVVEVVAGLTTVLFVRDLLTGSAHIGFTLQIVIWLWITVLFANFAEAVAEGRGKAQAATLRRARTETPAKRLTSATTTNYSTVPAPELKPGDIVLVEASLRAPWIALHFWASTHDEPTGRGTATLPSCAWRFMPMRTVRGTLV